jgi:hypothetical protein
LLLVSSSGVAQASDNHNPLLVVDKCPEFCPPGWNPPILVVDRCPEFCPGWRPPVEVCAQVLIPVPGEPGAYYTDSCMHHITRMPLSVEYYTPGNDDSIKDTILLPDPPVEGRLPPPDVMVCGLTKVAYEEPPHNLLYEVNQFIANITIESKKQQRVKNVLTLLAV